jgi:hypothetical protein
MRIMTVGLQPGCNGFMKNLQAGLWHQNEEKGERKWRKMYKQLEKKSKKKDKD